MTRKENWGGGDKEGKEGGEVTRKEKGGRGRQGRRAAYKPPSPQVSTGPGLAKPPVTLAKSPVS